MRKKIENKLKRFKHWFKTWKPIHLCWWFRKHGWKIPKYLIGATPWDISSAEWVQVRDVSAEETSPRGLFFNPDGTKMYIVGTGDDGVNEYTLSTPWDISSETWVRLLDVSAEEASPYGIFFKPDGTKMYIVGDGGKEVNEYTLSTPWDISSETHIQALDVTDKETTPRGISFSPDGDKMYIVGVGSDAVQEYTLSESWDISSAEWVRSKSVVDEELTVYGIFFKSDGTKMYIIGTGNDGVNEYDLPPVEGTNMEINIADTWKDATGIQINIGDVWKTVTKVELNVGDVWKTIFG